MGPNTPGLDPLVSIVTPSFQSGRFLEEAIRSVLSQDYPNIEYIVMDGGSTDESLDILHRYEGRLRYISEPDRGQCDAINRGFLLSRGEIFAWLCADDTYLPGAVAAAVRELRMEPRAAGVYGEGCFTDEQGRILGAYPTRDFDAELLKTECFICQPACFLRRDAFAAAGMLDVNVTYALDYDLWIRIAREGRLRRMDGILATSRMHKDTKTLGARRAVYRDIIRVLHRHFGYVPFRPIYGYCCSMLDRRDGFFEPVPPSAAKYLASILYGTLTNVRHPWRYWRECAAEGLAALRRRIFP